MGHSFFLQFFSNHVQCSCYRSTGTKFQFINSQKQLLNISSWLYLFHGNDCYCRPTWSTETLLELLTHFFFDVIGLLFPAWQPLISPISYPALCGVAVVSCPFFWSDYYEQCSILSTCRQIFLLMLLALSSVVGLCPIVWSMPDAIQPGLSPSKPILTLKYFDETFNAHLIIYSIIPSI